MATEMPQWAETDIADIGNGDPNKIEPSTAQKTDGWAAEIPLLQHMNWLQNNLAYWTRVANQSIEPANLALLTVGSINKAPVGRVFRLPADPLDGQSLVIFTEVDSNAEGNPPVVQPNGKLIQSCVAAEDLDLNISNATFQFRYNDSDSTWYVNLIGLVGSEL